MSLLSIIGAGKPASSAGSQITLVQQASASAAGVDVTATFPAPCTVGNSVIVAYSYPSGDTNSYAILTGGPDGTMTKIATITGTGIKTELWYKHAITEPYTAVNADTSQETQNNINITEWTHLIDAAPESTNSNTAAASTTVTTNSVTPVSASNLVIAMGAWTSNSYSSGPINSFTRLTQTGGGSVYQESAYLIQSAATINSTGWTLGSGINWAAGIAVFGGT